MKIKAADLLFGKMSGVADYKKIEKLMKIYNKIKDNPKKTKELDKIKGQLNILFPQTEPELERILETYNKSKEDMKDDNEVYSIEQANSFVSQLTTMKNTEGQLK